MISDLLLDAFSSDGVCCATCKHNTTNVPMENTQTEVCTSKTMMQGTLSGQQLFRINNSGVQFCSEWEGLGE